MRNLIDADLRGANLRGASLSGANLGEALLDETNLNGAHLEKTNLSGANLPGANLSGAVLHGANLSGGSFHRTYFTTSISAMSLAWTMYSLGAQAASTTKPSREVPICRWPSCAASACQTD